MFKYDAQCSEVIEELAETFGFSHASHLSEIWSDLRHPMRMLKIWVGRLVPTRVVPCSKDWPANSNDRCFELGEGNQSDTVKQEFDVLM